MALWHGRPGPDTKLDPLVKCALDPSCNRSDGAGANLVTVNFGNSLNLRTRSAEEDFICNIEFRPIHVTLLHRYRELLAAHLQDRPSGHTLQDPARDPRRDGNAVAHDKQAGSRP